jgi:two-component system response regulator PilR (NtrC family)
MTATRILVVDDEPDLRTLYELTLLRQGFLVETAEDLASALDCLEHHRFDVVITDMRLPDGLGIDILRHLKAQHRSERSVVITAHGSAENAVESLKAGAFDYLTKPVELQQFRAVIAAALRSLPAAASAPHDTTPPNLPNQGGAPAGGEPASTLHHLVGSSASMHRVRERILKVARSMAPVLVTGESGTGKELAARALHGNSHRGDKPFVAVNCGAIPEGLLEAEFFGAKKGAYTGSTQNREGFFQAAHGGTLFLDEIGDLPLAMQSKLLRAIQERVVRPVGSVQEEAVDVRIVSATHKNLAAEVQVGRFRQDLFYRLNVIDIHMPALRERREDLPALCQTLLRRIAAESGMAVPPLSAELLARLQAEPLTGNVRELENLLHRAVALRDHQGLQLDPPQAADIADRSGPSAAPPGPGPTSAPTLLPDDLQGHLDRAERAILIQALQETGFNRTAAAHRLGLSLRQIRYRIARLNIQAPQNPDQPDVTDDN